MADRSLRLSGVNGKCAYVSLLSKSDLWSRGKARKTRNAPKLTSPSAELLLIAEYDFRWILIQNGISTNFDQNGPFLDRLPGRLR